MTLRQPDDRFRRVHYLARLGAAMVAANFPNGQVKQDLQRAAHAYDVGDVQFVVLPSYVLARASAADTQTVEIANSGRELSYAATFELFSLVKRSAHAQVTPDDGLAELDHIRTAAPRFPTAVSIAGYAVKSAGFAMVLQPTPTALLAATLLGLLVGSMRAAVGGNAALSELLPVGCAFTVSLIAFLAARHWHLGDTPLRALAPPLAFFLPGTAITVSVIELSSGQLLSGSSRLAGGLMRLLQLAFGILAAAQVTDIGTQELINAPANRLGAWAPWVGVAVYALGLLLHFGPPPRALGWMLLMLYIAYAGQVLGTAVIGSYVGGFTGGAALSLAAFWCARYEHAPPLPSMLLPGFWLLVPGSLGLIEITELLGNNVTGTQSFAAALISFIAIALGVQTGLLLGHTSHTGPFSRKKDRTVIQ
jgi:uncharacterized membrane protein YjjP (DUF1212 family)